MEKDILIKKEIRLLDVSKEYAVANRIRDIFIAMKILKRYSTYLKKDIYKEIAYYFNNTYMKSFFRYPYFKNLI